MAFVVYSARPAFVTGKRLASSAAGEPKASAAVAWRLVAGATGEPMLLHQRGVDFEIGTEPGAYGSGTSCAGLVESAVSSFNLPAAEQRVRSGAPLAGVVLGVDMALSPDGKQLAVVSAGSGCGCTGGTRAAARAARPATIPDRTQPPSDRELRCRRGVEAPRGPP